MDGPSRVIAFGRRRVGRKPRRYADVAEIRLGPPAGGGEPLFEARVDKETVRMALDRFKARYEDRGGFLVLYGEDADEKVRKLVVFGGVRQTVDSSLGATVLEVVESMGELELLFWYSRFITAYERGNYWDVHRVAKSIKTLYKIRAR